MDNGIYLTDSDYKTHHLLFSFNNQERYSHRFKDPFFHSHQLWLKTTDSTYKFYYDDIWGYRDNRQDWRVYNGETYLVTFIGKICLYELPCFSVSGTYYAPYFSITPDTPVKSLTKSNLEGAYHSNKSFYKKLQQLKWYQSIFKWNKITHRYLFIEWM